MPQSMGEAMQLATIMARSTFVPGHCRANEGNCLAIIMQAGRWGMDPFAVANKAYFTKDGAPPAFEAQLVNAVVNASGALSGRLRIEYDGEIPVEISARHVHLSQADQDALFGKGYEMKIMKQLSQTGQWAAEEKVTVRGPKG